MAIRTCIYKQAELDWLGDYAGRMQHHTVKILYNTHTKFHNKLSFASKVISGGSLIEWREGDGTCNRHTTNECRKRRKSSKFSYSQN